MVTPVKTEIDVDELIQAGMFISPGGTPEPSVLLTSFGGILRLSSSKPANLIKLAALLHEAAVTLSISQKITEKKTSESW